MDVDGVMTDGTLLCFDDHQAIRVFNAKDSFAIRFALMQGYKVAVFTGGETEGVRHRLITCGIGDDDIYLGCRGKINAFRSFCDKYSLSPEEVLYIGDDIPDIPVIKAAGIGAAPSDAVREARDAADYVSSSPGGKGCVREIVEKVLSARQKWMFTEEMYEKLF